MNAKRITVPLAVVAALSLVAVARPAPQDKSPEPAMAAASTVTIEDCAGCHEDRVKAFAANPHSILDSQGLASKAGAAFSCTACHGDPTQHIDEGGGTGSIFAFGPDVPGPVKEEKCLTCHADVHPNFKASPHAAAGVECTSCHSIHSSGEHMERLLKQPEGASTLVGEDRVSAVCAQCHANVLDQFRFNERHRLQEGILECTSCHNPHQPQSRPLLGGFKQMECAQCHADKTGPFVFEHGSNRVEACVACHDPHGSPNRHQLKFQRVAELCFSCHAGVPSFHSRFTLDTNCTNCHSSIHGSNFSPFFLK